MVGVGALAHLHENQRAVAVAHDEIDFGAACARTPRHPIIALDQRQSLRQQVLQSAFFTLIASGFRRDP